MNGFQRNMQLNQLKKVAKKNQAYQVVNFENVTVSTNLNEWESLPANYAKRNRFDEDKVYYYREKQKQGRPRLRISFGNEVSALLDYKRGDNLQVLVSKKNPMVLRLLKSDSEKGGSTISGGKEKHHSLSISLRCPKQLQHISQSRNSKVVPHIFFDDDSLGLDFSQVEQWENIER